jgi:hypothetical protein
MTVSRYPGITDQSLAVLIRADPGEPLTPQLVARALSATSIFVGGTDSFEAVRADLD